MKAVLTLALILGVCGLIRAAEDKKVVQAVGTWKCEYEIGGQKRTSTLKIKKDGDGYTGTMGWADQDDTAVKDLKLKEDTLTFSAGRKLPGLDTTITIDYKLTITGDEIKGKGSSEFNDQKQEWDIKAKREKASKS